MSELTTVFLTRRFDRINPESIDDYIADGGYEALRKALTLSKSAVIDEVKASGLKGRGGAGYPTGLKMQAVAQASGYPKYIICNADEGEPGNFKDRYMMEKDPHQFIEGMVISAYATGAEKGYVFIRGEYDNAIAIVEKALSQARMKGFVGQNILDRGFDFEIEVFTGAGSYVCGEEYSLMVCIEGRPGRSTYKPPYPTHEGLFNKPTQINNVETFANIPHILSMGGAEFAKMGTDSSKGTKLISLSGNINKPGMYEVNFGITIRDIIEKLGGGVRDGRKVKLVQLGGASGPVINPSMLDLRLDYKEMQDAGLSFGSGAVIVVDDTHEVLDILKRGIEFFHHESCGKCTPCREGNIQMLILLQKFIDKTATAEDYKLLDILMEVMGGASICGLGQAAPTALKSALKNFSGEFEVSKVNMGEAV